jgi:hypothetical protein
VIPVIEFLCPNGHKISCQAEQAGKAAKCPRCGVRFRIPDANEFEFADTAVSSNTALNQVDFIDSSLISSLAPPDSSAIKKEQVAKKEKEPEIEFLCPNGHRLHGPASLQGRPGACPECGSRFKIPTYEDVSPDESTAQNLGVGHINGSDISSRSLNVSAGSPSTITKTGVGADALARFVAKLWSLCPKAALEIGLNNGETIIPDRFLPKASRESGQGVFAMEKSDGTVALTLVAWNAVARVTVRNLKKLPPELAE